MSELKEYQIRPGISIRTAQKPITIEEWRHEAVALFGKNPDGWRFRCPMCGKSYSLREFLNASTQNNPELAFRECIGRYLGAGSPGAADGNPNGCDWAAYGLLGIPNDKGLLVEVSEGEVIEIFDFDREVQ